MGQLPVKPWLPSRLERVEESYHTSMGTTKIKTDATRGYIKTMGNRQGPHALACEIDEFREGSSPLYIRAVLHVERESQKRIVIGANGQQIKKLGKTAREKIERFVGQPVYLDLWVKVLPNWRKNRSAVLRLGYGDPNTRQ